MAFAVLSYNVWLMLARLTEMVVLLCLVKFGHIRKMLPIHYQMMKIMLYASGYGFLDSALQYAFQCSDAYRHKSGESPFPDLRALNVANGFNWSAYYFSYYLVLYYLRQRSSGDQAISIAHTKAAVRAFAVFVLTLITLQYGPKERCKAPIPGWNAGFVLQALLTLWPMTPFTFQYWQPCWDKILRCAFSHTLAQYRHHHYQGRPSILPLARWWTAWFLVTCVGMVGSAEVTIANRDNAFFYIYVVFIFFNPLVFYKCLLQDSEFWKNLGSRMTAADDDRQLGAGRTWSELREAQLNLDERLLNLPAEDPSLRGIDFSLLILGDKFAAGGNANVRYGWMKTGPTTETPLALKEFFCDELTPEVCDMVLSEARIISRLSSPFVVTFHGVSVSPPYIYLAFELCERGSLSEVLMSINETQGPMRSRGRQSCPNMSSGDLLSNVVGGGGDEQWSIWRRQLIMAFCAAKAVQYLHQEMSIVHRDIKSPNFLVNERWHVKLADFGEARDVGKPRLMTRGIGTPQWMAPEVVMKEEFSVSSDIYSLAIVLWECLTCLVPFHHLPLTSIAPRVCMEGLRPQIPEGTLPCYAAMLQEAWHDDPKMRSSAGAIAAQIEAMLTQAGTAAPDPAAAERESRSTTTTGTTGTGTTGTGTWSRSSRSRGTPFSSNNSRRSRGSTEMAVSSTKSSTNASSSGSFHRSSGSRGNESRPSLLERPSFLTF